MKVADIIEVVEQFAPPQLADVYDNTGLLVGDREKPISKLLVCVDVTEEVVCEAKEMGAEMILSHHPLIFSGLKKIGSATYIERCVTELIKNDISLYCCHTSIDSTFGGISFKMGELLGLKNMEVLEPRCPNGEGYGVVGEFDEERELSEIFADVKTIFGTKVIRHTQNFGGKIKKVALCGGSGASLIEKAKSSMAQLYISADFKYHDFFSAEKSIILADIGHFESESVVLEIFCDIISKKYCNFAVRKTKTNSNPIIYV